MSSPQHTQTWCHHSVLEKWVIYKKLNCTGNIVSTWLSWKWPGSFRWKSFGISSGPESEVNTYENQCSFKRRLSLQNLWVIWVALFSNQTWELYFQTKIRCILVSLENSLSFLKASDTLKKKIHFGIFQQPFGNCESHKDWNFLSSWRLLCI